MPTPRLDKEDIEAIAEEVSSSINSHETYCRFGELSVERLTHAVELIERLDVAVTKGRNAVLDTILKMLIGALLSNIPDLWRWLINIIKASL